MRIFSCMGKDRDLVGNVVEVVENVVRYRRSFCI
jgi:hypothetical protein